MHQFSERWRQAGHLSEKAFAEIQPVWKAYLGVCWLYLISNVFTLAKMLRDRHEADLLARTAAAERAEKAAERGTAGDARQA